jgi:hypothetical protein
MKRWNPKHSSHTPLVIDALVAQGHTHLKRYTSPRNDAVDFQYTSPFIHGTYANARASLRRRTSEQRVRSLLASPNLSYKSILAAYINNLHVSDAHALDEDEYLHRIATVFTDEVLTCLRDGGFAPTDVVAWAWILSAPKSVQAATRLHAYSNRNLSPSEASTPTFLLQMILLRKIISAPALRLLVINSFDRLANFITEDWKLDLKDPSQRIPDRCISLDISHRPLPHLLPLMDQRPYPGLMETTVIVLAIRLMRHARKTWPELLPHIARLFTFYVVGRTNRRKIQTAQLSFVYNKILQLFSHQSDRYFKQIKYHQEAQMIIIRAMGELNPPLLVDRMGYRAVTSVQLAHEKTPSEVDWALQKSKSWPPWQEARLGIDEEIGEEAGISRAGVALSQLAESGYQSMSWEDAAGIMAGWDTDHSPTIQTRRYFPVTRDSDDPRNSTAVVWAARIRATRTLEEAWAIFLSCQDASSDTAAPYLAMAEKLLGRARMHRDKKCTETLEDDIESDPLPGDDPESFEPSRNPKERPYLRTPVPTIEQFLEHAEQRGVNIGGLLLVPVLERSHSYELGRRLLRKSHLPANVVDMVLGLTKPTYPVLREIDDRLLLAILRWHTFRFNADAVSMLGHGQELAFRNGDYIGPTKQTFLAFALVSASRTTYKPAWTPLFRALTPPSQKKMHLSLSRISWTEMRRLIHQMEDREIGRTWSQFIYLCRTFSLVNIAAAEENDPASPRRDPELISGTALLKREFEKLTGTKLTSSHDEQTAREESPAGSASETTKSSSLSSITRAPNFNELHMFIQALGLAQDHRGVLEVIIWMRDHLPSIQTRHPNQQARKVSRRCMVATRGFLEGLWNATDPSSSGGEPAAEEIVSKARHATEKIAGPSAWPSDEEVSNYRAHDVATHPEAMGFASPGRG